jgi:hypothetical protein
MGPALKFKEHAMQYEVKTWFGETHSYKDGLELVQESSYLTAYINPHTKDLYLYLTSRGHDEELKEYWMDKDGYVQGHDEIMAVSELLHNPIDALALNGFQMLSPEDVEALTDCYLILGRNFDDNDWPKDIWWFADHQVVNAAQQLIDTGFIILIYASDT